MPKQPAFKGPQFWRQQRPKEITQGLLGHLTHKETGTMVLSREPNKMRVPNTMLSPKEAMGCFKCAKNVRNDALLEPALLSKS